MNRLEKTWFAFRLAGFRFALKAFWWYKHDKLFKRDWVTVPSEWDAMMADIKQHVTDKCPRCTPIFGHIFGDDES